MFSFLPPPVIASKQEHISKRKPSPLLGLFNLETPRVTAYARKYSAKQIKGITDKTRKAVRELIAQSNSEGLTVQQVARRLRDSVGLLPRQVTALSNLRRSLELRGVTEDRIGSMMERAGKHARIVRSTNIARTEIAHAQTAGAQELFDQLQEQGWLAEESEKKWIVTGDELLCPICAPMQGVTAALKDNFEHPELGEVENPPLHPSCLPGDSYVSSISPITAASKRWYEGEMVVIRTAGGYQLSCTPNHPVLTRHGWVAAGLLNKGNDVICSGFQERIPNPFDARTDDNDAQMPSTIEKIADAFRHSPQMRSAKVPVSAEDFHGDGIGGQVAVVWANRLLRNRYDPGLTKRFGDLLLKRVLLADSFNGFGFSHQALYWHLASFQRPVSSGGLQSSFGRTHLKPFDFLGFGLAPQRDAGIRQYLAYCSAIKHIFFGELIRRASGGIFTDDVVDIRLRPFNGHVYNLQTVFGWYAANGIITQNCRCDFSILDPKPGPSAGVKKFDPDQPRETGGGQFTSGGGKGVINV